MAKILTVENVIFEIEAELTEELIARARQEGIKLGKDGIPCSNVAPTPKIINEDTRGIAYAKLINETLQAGETVWIHPLSIFVIIS
jgi:hypothetical protein